MLTCPTTACFDGLPDAPERVTVGGQLRHFGDKFQASKVLDGQRYWRIPVMEGEFLVQETFGIQKAIGGGNLLILAGIRLQRSLQPKPRSKRCVPCPALSCRSPAASCAPAARSALRRQEHDRINQRRVLSNAPRTAGVITQLPQAANSVLEIVVDGLDRPRSSTRCAPASRPRAARASSRSQRATTAANWVRTTSTCTNCFRRGGSLDPPSLT